MAIITKSVKRGQRLIIEDGKVIGSARYYQHHWSVGLDESNTVECCRGVENIEKAVQKIREWDADSLNEVVCDELISFRKRALKVHYDPKDKGGTAAQLRELAQQLEALASKVERG